MLSSVFLNTDLLKKVLKIDYFTVFLPFFLYTLRITRMHLQRVGGIKIWRWIQKI